MIKYFFSDILKQYRIPHSVQDDKVYKQVTISKTNKVSFRRNETGSKIGRKRQFIVDLNQFPSTLMFTRQGVASGAIGLAPEEINQAIATENMPMFEVLTTKVLPDYLLYYLKSDVFKQHIAKLVPLGTAQKSIHERDLLKTEIYIPTLSKQKEIVEKLELFTKLTNSMKFEVESQQIQLSKLRNSILNDAIKGKLVQQCKNDDSTNSLLKDIKSEKELLIKEKKIKKEVPFPQINDDEKPFELPNNWHWVRAGDITTIKGGKRLPAGAKFSENPTNNIYIRVSDMKNYTISTNDLRYINDELHKKISSYIIKKEDLYITIVGSTIGKVGKVPDELDGANLTENAARIIPHKVNKDYLLFVLTSSTIQNQLLDMTNQVGQPKLALSRLKSTIVPLPPLEEQNRIVDKVKHLMTLCDELEVNLQLSKQKSESLIKTVLQEAFSTTIK